MGEVWLATQIPPFLGLFSLGRQRETGEGEREREKGRERSREREKGEGQRGWGGRGWERTGFVIELNQTQPCRRVLTWKEEVGGRK